MVPLPFFDDSKNKKVKGQASTLRDGIIICTDFTANITFNFNVISEVG